VSISPLFYVVVEETVQDLLNFINILLLAARMKVFCPAFFYSLFGLIIFWRRNIGAKAALEMLVKLTIQGLTLSSKIGKAFFTTKSRSTKKLELQSLAY